MIRFIFFILALLFTLSVEIHQSAAIEPPFVADEVIVKYKTGKSPEELKKVIEEKKARKQTFLGFFLVWWEDLRVSFRGGETAEDVLQKLENMDKKIGVVSKKQLFPNAPKLANTYLIKLKKKNVQDAVKLYKSLPEVEYAEPNYILRIQ